MRVIEKNNRFYIYYRYIGFYYILSNNNVICIKLPNNIYLYIHYLLKNKTYSSFYNKNLHLKNI